MLINLVIKPLWGRARPAATTEFGGSLIYTTPFQLSDQCHRACSFVSGETSALFPCATVFCLLVLPLLRPGMRLWAMAGIGFLAISGSLLRIAFGGHFLSDVIFSAVISTLLTLVFFLAMRRFIGKAAD